jgi:hypothetical protein
MAEDVVDELAEKIGDRLNELGLGLIKCIVFQIAPDYDPQQGTLLHGKCGFPFVSICHLQPEQFDMGVSTETTTFVNRKFTVAIVGDKKIVEPNPTPFTTYRAKAIRKLHTHRWDGQINSIPNASIMHATVQPQSPIQQSAWANSAKFVSVFDVIVQTEEPNG